MELHINGSPKIVALPEASAHETGCLTNRRGSDRFMSNFSLHKLCGSKTAFVPANLLGVPIAAGVLNPVFGVLLNPMIASAAMTFSTVSVISNAPRLRNLEL
jgi:hypothetical protein